MESCVHHCTSERQETGTFCMSPCSVSRMSALAGDLFVTSKSWVMFVNSRSEACRLAAFWNLSASCRVQQKLQWILVKNVFVEFANDALNEPMNMTDERTSCLGVKLFQPPSGCVSYEGAVEPFEDGSLRWIGNTRLAVGKSTSKLLWAEADAAVYCGETPLDVPTEYRYAFGLINNGAR